MSKKLLLLALPALMVLSGCGAHNIEKPANKQALEMCEDNLAHEEIFGGEQDTAILTKKNPYKLVTLTSASVKIGYQIQFDDKGTTEGEGHDEDDTISIRFVAALTDAVESASWHRGLAQSNGCEGADVGGGVWKYKFNDGTSHPSTTFYTALNNGGDRVVAGEDEFAGYTCFAIYTLMNIPYVYYSNSYLAAYVTLTGANTINSQGLAIRIEKDGDASADRFYFNPDVPGHFLAGTINDVVRDGSDNSTHKLLREDETTVSSDENYASFSDVDLLSTDNFGAFYFSSTHFQFFGYDYFFNKSRGFFNASGSLSDYAVPVQAGNYNLYMKNKNNESEENFVYGYANSYVTNPTDVYFMPGVWETDGAEIRMYCFVGSAPGVWVAPAETGTTPAGKMMRFELDSSNYRSILFARMNPSRENDNWDAVWTQTGDYVDFFFVNGPRSTVVVAGWGNYQITH